jgi:lipopolysaccharide biosynthesis regulator YciM
MDDGDGSRFRRRTTLTIDWKSRMGALLLSATVSVGAAHAAAERVAQSSDQKPTPQSAAAKAPHAKSKTELDAYQAAVSQTDPAKLESAATDFAQKYPGSELRPYLFQRAMGLYQQSNNPGKTLEMARAVLKHDPANPVALLGAAQILAERTHDDDLDRKERLQEAGADGQAALQHAGELARPANLTAEQFADAVAQLRDAAHEVLATVAYKKHDYRKAIEEYTAIASSEKAPVEAVVWLRLAAAHEKLGEYSLGIADADKAIAATEPGSPVRELAEREKIRLKAMAATAAAQPVAKQSESSGLPGPGK